MIRAFCCVCRDVVVTGQEPATASCGHVYHHSCLEAWLKCKKTCPKCRQKINQPIVLYLDQPSDGGGEELLSVDTAMLQDQIEQERTISKEKDRKMEYLSSEIKNLEEKLTEAKERCIATADKLRTANNIGSALKKQMAYLKQQERDFAEAKQEATRCRENLEQHQRIKMLIEGSRSDAEDMLQNIGGSNSKEVITQLVILKREYEKVKHSRNKAREYKDQYEREITRLKRELSSRETDARKAQEQLSLTENDLSRLEKENTSLKKKMSKLEQAFSSPSPRSSALTRLMRESPAPMEFKRPRLSPPEEYDENAENLPLVSDHLAPNNDLAERKPKDPEMDKVAKEMGLTLVKTTTFSTKPAVKKLPNTLLAQSRKRPAGDDGSSVFRTGYNGMGGHSTKFLKPNKPVKPLAKKVARPNTISKFVKRTKDGEEPPLPILTLDFT